MTSGFLFVSAKVSAFIQPGLDFGLNLVADFAEELKSFIHGAIEGGWVFKRPVQTGAHAGEEGAALVGITADGDEEIEVDFPLILIEVFGTMPAHIITGFFHDCNCVGVDAVRFQPCAVDLETVAAQVA